VLDGDDLVGRDLVEYARKESDARGYLIETGYALHRQVLLRPSRARRGRGRLNRYIRCVAVVQL